MFNVYLVQMMQNEDRETARPVSASSYSEICPLIGLSASIDWEATWLWLAKEFEHAGLPALDNPAFSSASLALLKLCLTPCKKKAIRYGNKIFLNKAWIRAKTEFRTFLHPNRISSLPEIIYFVVSKWSGEQGTAAVSSELSVCKYSCTDLDY